MITERRSLLILEDEESHVEAIRRALEKAEANVEIRIVGTLREFRASVAERMPDLALIDLNLPDGRAVELLTQPLETAPFPILVMTAFGNQEIVAEVMKAGALDYVVKSPETFAAMPQTLERVFREWKLLQKHKQAKEEVQSGKTFLDNIINAIADPVFVKDDKRCFVLANDALCAAVGRPREALIGEDGNELFPKEQVDVFVKMDAGVLDTGTENVNEEALSDLSTGEVRTIVTRKTCYIDPNGRKFLVGVIRDITERKQGEEALREANLQLNAALTELKTSQAQMIQQARLGALGQMASGIVHDFNNLLVPLLGFSDLLLNDPSILEDRKETHELLTAMHTAARDARNLVRRLREFYHPDETLETEDVILRTLIEESLSLTEPRWKQQARAQGAMVTVQQEYADLPPITCNRTQIREVFTNVILNAVDAMPKGGTLAIRTQSEPGGVMATLRDSGIGMTEDARQHCLEPYFSTKGAKGTGMGLAMAYGVIQRHGGNIGVESEVGKGTAITIHLPLKPPKSAKAVVAPVHVAARRSLRVLAVDDEEWVLSLVGRYLKSAGHTVEKAANGMDAIRRFAEGGFDLVVTDRAMPDMSGDQVAKAIKKQSPKTPVLLLTGFGEMMKEEGERPAGVDAILGKPMTRDELLQAIERVTGGAGGR